MLLYQAQTLNLPIWLIYLEFRSADAPGSCSGVGVTRAPTIVGSVPRALHSEILRITQPQSNILFSEELNVYAEPRPVPGLEVILLVAIGRLSNTQSEWYRERLIGFMDTYVYPAEFKFENELENSDNHKVLLPADLLTLLQPSMLCGLGLRGTWKLFFHWKSRFQNLNRCVCV